MNQRQDHNRISDEDLVAYIDDALERSERDALAQRIKADSTLRDRLALLQRGNRPFREAYDILLGDAPGERLNAILSAAQKQSSGIQLGESPVSPVKTGWSMAIAAAVLLAIFAAGALTGQMFIEHVDRQVTTLAPAKKGWRAVVAEYQKLFVTATLENASQDARAQAVNLQSALRHVGLDLTVEKVTPSQDKTDVSASLSFKRADILSFKGKPLVQIAYLFDGRIPVSFCIIRSRKPAHGEEFEQREGLNIVYWHDPSFGYMIIGDIPRDELGRIARQLRQNLS